MRVRKILLVHVCMVALAFNYSIENCGPYKAEIEYAVTLTKMAMMKPLRDVHLDVASRYVWPRCGF